KFFSYVVISYRHITIFNLFTHIQPLSLHDALPVLQVRVRTSKTDRDSAGAAVAVPYGSLARTCPVRTTLAWIDALAEIGITSGRSEEHTSELQSRENLVCRLLLEKKNSD